MKSQIDSRTVGIQQPRDGDFLLFNKSGSKVHISGLLQLACMQGYGGWEGRGSERLLAGKRTDGFNL